MTKSYNTTSCLGYELFADSLGSIPLNQKIEIDTINQYSYCIAEEDPEFKAALKASDVLLPDGVGMTWASKFLNGNSIKKIAGADIHQYMLEEMNKRKGSCFYLGASQRTLDCIQNKISKEFPNITFGAYSPPYKSSFSLEDSNLMIEKVNEFKPNVLFIGMTAPKQEKWSHSYKKELDANIICSIGAVFDFYAGTVQRPSKIWIDLGLEWLGRFFKEPKRMWRRYFYYGGIFVFQMIGKKLKIE